MITRSVFVNDDVTFGSLGLQDSLETLPLLLPTMFQSFPFALITCSDGGTGAWLAEKLAEFNSAEGWNLPYHMLIDGTVAVSGADYYKIATSLLFMGGYEEVWFYDELPALGPPKDVVTMLTFPSVLTDAEIQRNVALWMQYSKSSLAIGDGAGIIFATPRQEIVYALSSIVSADDVFVGS